MRLFNRKFFKCSSPQTVQQKIKYIFLNKYCNEIFQEISGKNIWCRGLEPVLQLYIFTFNNCNLKHTVQPLEKKRLFETLSGQTLINQN
jgi:hypothetical protein